MVSNFLNIGNSTPAGIQFNNAAEVAFKAEVDELTHKVRLVSFSSHCTLLTSHLAVLDQYIGNDPQVSIANLTLTNGVFQSVVDNLDIMAVQGKAKQNLITTINQYRCVQILPSIDTYLAVAARVINGTAGTGATLRTSVYPSACAAIMAADASNPALFPNVPNVPGGTPLAPSEAPNSAGSSSEGAGSSAGSVGSASAGAGSNNGSSTAGSSGNTAGTPGNGGNGVGRPRGYGQGGYGQGALGGQEGHSGERRGNGVRQ
jgi:hypothetical protein